jgi:hypothetical protein
MKERAFNEISKRSMYAGNETAVTRERLDKNPLIAARQRLGRNVTAVTNTLATIE